jgi:hypothetical protein
MTGSSSGGFSLIPPGTKIPGHVNVVRELKACGYPVDANKLV